MDREDGCTEPPVIGGSGEQLPSEADSCRCSGLEIDECRVHGDMVIEHVFDCQQGNRGSCRRPTDRDSSPCDFRLGLLLR